MKKGKTADQPRKDKDAGIRFEEVSKWYGDVMGLIDVSVTIGEGVIGILGPNGAGKSTFIKLATGQIKPDKGTVTAQGMPVWNNPDYNRVLGYCPEHENLYNYLTGEEFVRFMLRIHGYGGEESEARAREALDTVGLVKEAGRKIGGYSKGMKQRLKLAQAMAHKPDILFLDEPLAGTDPVGRVRMIKLIRKLGSEEGRTIVVSSHILHEIERMTKRVLMLHKGRLLAWGDMREIRDKLDQYPHTLRIHTPEGRRLAEGLIGLREVSAVEADDEKGFLDVKVVEPDAFYTELPKILTDEGIEIRQLGSLDEDLESIFTYLTERRGRS